MGKISPALKKEFRRIGIGTAALVFVMWAVFGVLHRFFPDSVPFDYTVILGGLVCGAIAVLNFFLMGLTVQRITATDDEEAARKMMKLSQSRRYLMVFGWGIIALLVPAFNPVAGLVPLLFPGIVIKTVYPFILKNEANEKR